MLLIPDSEIPARRQAARSALEPLATSLRKDLLRALSNDIYVPEDKALLSKAGGYCSTDRARLSFDPASPHRHECPECGAVYSGELHDRFWVFPYQLWLAERAVHAALLSVLTEDAACGTIAREILNRYSKMYHRYPNNDNVLGPSRLFFSTYLESIWLLQICVANDLLRFSGDRDADVIECIVQPGSEIISEFDEGLSNRQVWNNAALLASALLRGDSGAADRIVHGPSGVETHLVHGLLEDGTWYEGENYHQFAHRGLWYCVTLATNAGIAIKPGLLERFDRGFLAPFLTALPDFTMPSRKDSVYAVSLRQWHFAESCELGFARTGDSRLAGVLRSLYDCNMIAGDTGRSRSTADVEQNTVPTRISRADLGWRSLLHAVELLPTSSGWQPGTVSLDNQGITVFRRNTKRDTVYVALDWGQSGGGHGHPDRLNLLLSHGDTRWLDDMGTGSYVDPSLHWYRSTLAHNAPLIDGRSQSLTDGELLAFAEDGGMGWASARATLDGILVTRTAYVSDSYLIDEVCWHAHRSVRFELPVHVDIPIDGPSFEPIELKESENPSDGFAFTTGCSVTRLSANTMFDFRLKRHGHAMHAWIGANSEASLHQLNGPGQPATLEKSFLLVRVEGDHGTIRSVWEWSGEVRGVSMTRTGVTVELEAEKHVHTHTPDGWACKRTGSNSVHTLHSGGTPIPVTARHHMGANHATRPTPIKRNTTYEFELTREHYRRSEIDWDEIGRPSATVRMSVLGDNLKLEIDARTGAPVFVPVDASNPFDNEHPDINGDGVQLYITSPTESGAWMLLPQPRCEEPRIRPILGWGDAEIDSSTWHQTTDGFAMTIIATLPASSFGIDVLINETTPHRNRRRGQLVLSSAPGEWIYLRGDRHDPRRLLQFELVD